MLQDGQFILFHKRLYLNTKEEKKQSTWFGIQHIFTEIKWQILLFLLKLMYFGVQSNYNYIKLNILVETPQSHGAYSGSGWRNDLQHEGYYTILGYNY